ncbi:QWRF motif-containing protein 3 [Pyrus ussuriensis x Pyrus communis]|uniref:QWRF motif-containing protein 3 n=1 Tax=Pyrus ussuriensis x Pyrus communis TaxID=2448454 RepID=A0A5N5GIE6_9ROSA|nr:QWRF motif-containing protein 3 [Pyrus ussuriensis x Pyrus communis]
MKNDQVVTDQSHKPRRAKSREVSSRFLSSPTTTETTTLPSPNHPISPVRRKPVSPFSDARKPKTQLEDSGPTRGLWPSSNSSHKKLDTLADHLGNDRREDRVQRKDSIFDRGRSCREFGSLDNPKEKGRESPKENHLPFLGGSMRYTGKFRFSRKSNSSSSSTSSSSSKFSSSSNVAAPRRFSVDENALYQKQSRRNSDGFPDTLDSESECSDGSSGMIMGSPNIGSAARKSGVEYMNEIPLRHRRGTSDSNIANPISGDKSPKLNKFTIKNVMRRAHSLTATTQWALSPGRTGSPTMSVENKGVPMSFSSLKPPTSPSKTKGVEKLFNMGLDLFKSKKSSSSNVLLVRSNSVSSGSSMTEMGHQLRLLHNRYLQWRFANARAAVVNQNIADQAQVNVLYALDALMKLRHSVLQKKVKLQKERLDMRLNLILYSQLKQLDSWGDMERQHMAAVCTMKECLHSVVCRVPLVEGAEADTQSASVALRHASDLTTSIKLLLCNFSPLAEQAAPLLSELAEVAAQEKLLLEECLELFRNISILEDGGEAWKETVNLDGFFKEIENVQRDMRAVVLKLVKLIKGKLEKLELSNADQRKVPGCGTGSSSDRTRISVLNSLAKKLKDMMDDFQRLRAKIACEYKATVQRRYFTITGEKANKETIENLISSGEGETLLQKAIEEQGRGQVLDTVQEIQERLGAVKEMEKSLIELHQVFLYMAALVEAQGQQLNDIEGHVACANSFVRRGTVQLEVAKDYQKSTRKCTCIAIVVGTCVIVILLLPILLHFKS